MEICELDNSAVWCLLPDRKADTHKGDYGKLLLLCGSRGYSGAAALSAMAALRTGAGLVYLAVPTSIYEIEATKLLEPIVMPLPDRNGMISTDALSDLGAILDRMDVVLVGPGLGQSEDVKTVVTWVLKNFKGPVVLDADGINVLSSHTDILRDRKESTIITPHDVEFGRLGGKITDDRVASAMSLANALGVIVLLYFFVIK